jgi:hypothetical protein
VAPSASGLLRAGEGAQCRTEGVGCVPTSAASSSPPRGAAHARILSSAAASTKPSSSSCVPSCSSSHARDRRGGEERTAGDVQVLEDAAKRTRVDVPPQAHAAAGLKRGRCGVLTLPTMSDHCT